MIWCFQRFFESKRVSLFFFEMLVYPLFFISWSQNGFLFPGRRIVFYFLVQQSFLFPGPRKFFIFLAKNSFRLLVFFLLVSMLRLWSTTNHFVLLQSSFFVLWNYILTFKKKHSKLYVAFFCFWLIASST